MKTRRDDIDPPLSGPDHSPVLHASVRAFALTLMALLAASCAGAEKPHRPVGKKKTHAVKEVKEAKTTPKVAPPAEVVLPPCGATVGAPRRVLSMALTPRADLLVVLRQAGCLETWDVALGTRVAVKQGSPGATYVFIRKEPVAVTDDKHAYSAASLAETEMPKDPPPPAVVHEDSSVGISGLDPALSKALAKWAARSRVKLRTDDSRTWLTPKPIVDGEVRDLNMTADGKLLSDNESLVRLDTGKQGRFPSWTKGFAAMSDETFDGTVQVSLGPRSDRAVVLSIARMGAGGEDSDAILVNTDTMKRMTTLSDACYPHDVEWSPHGAWVARQPCDHGSADGHWVAVDTATGQIRRDIPLGTVVFSDDDHTVVAGGSVMDLTTGAVSFELPDTKEP